MPDTNDQMQKQREEQYKVIAKKHQPKPKVWINSLKAFVVGGSICMLGQGISNMYVTFFGFKPEKAGDPTVATLIFISCLLTGLGVYDKIGQWAGAGTSVPVTGFANSICSAALEHQSEGYVLGVGGNMFKLAGAVIVFGTVAAFFVGIIHTLIIPIFQ
ncbi:stage V sporulation protein AC [Hazenella sp. IB182357]|uniref:Stage V sporulation protein AC n=1 Tax=Polycladospora coralii TaxID=2771432 RepID=A0A926N8V2_9BACL|nr:stage V sporulation protein AC [Polycladospora coralii]MBD1370960.1 stage V sporulation protein AC [Polycladospora coralii]MBS7529899.1 stage V sporulation protein AC [Polycladospora coralii]